MESVFVRVGMRPRGLIGRVPSGSEDDVSFEVGDEVFVVVG